MFTQIARTLSTAAAAVVIACCASASFAQNATPSVNASANGGVGGVIKIQVISQATGGAKVTGTIHVQTTAGVIDATYNSFSTYSTSKGATYATGTALGYYQATTGGAMVPTQITVQFANVPGSKGNLTVTMSNYYSKAVFYNSGAMTVLQGHVSIVAAN